MSNLTWTDNRHNIPKLPSSKWEWENGATSTFRRHESPLAFWRITPIHTVMGQTNIPHNDFAERTMWFVEFGSDQPPFNHWTPMTAHLDYEQEWSASWRWATCKETSRYLFFSLNDAKKFCEQTHGFSTTVNTRAVN